MWLALIVLATIAAGSIGWGIHSSLVMQRDHAAIDGFLTWQNQRAKFTKTLTDKQVVALLDAISGYVLQVDPDNVELMEQFRGILTERLKDYAGHS